MTASASWGPVTPKSWGKAARIISARVPKQPVTRTRPFSAKASPMTSMDSSTAASMKPQVLTITSSARL